MAQYSTHSRIPNTHHSNSPLVPRDLDLPALGAELFGGLRRAVLFDHIRVPRRADAPVVLADVGSAVKVRFASGGRCHPGNRRDAPVATEAW